MPILSLNMLPRSAKKKIIILSYLLPLYLLVVTLHSNAQSSGKLIHEGNKQYKDKKYSDAEINYLKSLEKKENPFVGNYNLGNTYYQQGKFEEAKKQYEIAAGMNEVSKENRAKTYHNLGNAFLKDKKYEESIHAYKEALKIKPEDNDTRYNLAYAKAMLQKQEQQKQQDNKNDKDKDKKDKDKKEDKKEEQKKQQEQEQKEDKKEENKQEQQAKKDKISKEDAEKILQALNNEEKKTQKKLNVKESTRISIDKQW